MEEESGGHAAALTVIHHRMALFALAKCQEVTLATSAESAEIKLKVLSTTRGEFPQRTLSIAIIISVVED